MIHHLVDHRSGRDLGGQRVPVQLGGEALPYQRWKIANQKWAECGIRGSSLRPQTLAEVQLGIGQQYGQFRRGETCSLGFAFQQRVGVRQCLQAPVQSGHLLEVSEIAGVYIEHGRRQRDAVDQRLVLVDVVGQHQSADIIGHVSQH